MSAALLFAVVLASSGAPCTAVPLCAPVDASACGWWADLGGTWHVVTNGRDSGAVALPCGDERVRAALQPGTAPRNVFCVAGDGSLLWARANAAYMTPLWLYSDHDMIEKGRIGR